MNVRPCTECEVPIFFALSKNKKKMPMVAEPVVPDKEKPLWHRGLFVLGTFNIEHQLDEANAARPEDVGPFYSSHFADCRSAHKFRRG